MALPGALTKVRSQAPRSGLSTVLAATAFLTAAGADSPALTAQVLLAHVLGRSRAHLLAHPELTLFSAQQAEYDRLVARAALGEPLAYLTGSREFYGLDFAVEPGVLVPRPETELLVELALARRPQRILDVGTGTGCIAIALAVHLRSAVVTALDLSPAALALAGRNAAQLGVASRLTLLESDLLSTLLPPPTSFQPPTSGLQLPVSSLQPPTTSFAFDLVVANLPYIDRTELASLPVARHEPWLALDGGPGGLVLVGRLLRQVARWPPQAVPLFAPGAALLLEIGAGQGPAALALARSALPSTETRIHPDLAGHDRVLEISLPGAA
jgi:release factor glutamine methyltransferase